MAYKEEVHSHYHNPRNVGSFAEGTENVGTGIVGAPACGDVMKLQILVDPETKVIKNVVFKTFGCAAAIASSSYLTTLVKGKTLEESKKIKNTQIVEKLSLPPVKIHCSVLAEEAIAAAITDYEKNQLSSDPDIQVTKAELEESES